MLLKKVEKHIIKYSLFYGIFIIIVCFPILWRYRGNYNLIRTLPIGVSWIGIVLVLEYLTYKIFGYTYRFNTPRRRYLAKRIILIAIIFTLILDIYGGIFPRLWSYSDWSFIEYTILAIPAYIVYSYSLLMTYRLVKYFFNKYIKGGRLSNTRKRIYPYLMKIQLTLGILLFIASTLYLIGFIFRNTLILSDLTIAPSEQIVWWFPFGPMISIYFISEFISFRQEKETLTRNFLRGSYLSYISILIASIIGIILFEFYNAPFLIWEYSNWPLSDIRILEMPLLGIIWWHTQFLALVSMLRVSIPHEYLDLW
jgi:hypothetical protein